MRWLSLRVRFACAGIFVISLFLPPYVPTSSLAAEEPEEEKMQFLLVEDGFLMKTSSLTEQGSRLAYAEGIYHTVESGESITSIAKLYKIKVETIRWANKLDDNAGVKPGQSLLILPVDGMVHIVARGQNLIRISEMYDVPVELIAQQNDIKDGYLRAGEQLIIPGGKPIVTKPTVIATTPKQNTSAPPAATGGKQSSSAAPVKPIPPRRQIYESTIGKGILQSPCGCYITQYFGSSHFALDMQERDGKGGFGGPVLAAAAGKVIRADNGWNGGYGNVVEIDNGNGIVTLYAHNKVLHVKVGDEVARGEQIADMGRTGLVYGATGIHVHFEVRVNGVKKNPMLYLDSGGIAKK